MRRLTLTPWFVGLFALLTSSAWAGPIWDANADFSTTNGNPNGAWTYGWVDNSFINSFHLDTLANDYGLNGNIPGWCGPIPGPGTGLNFPVIWKNTGPAVSGLQTGQLSLHPGPDGEPSVLEWTAPAGFSGDALIQGQFLPGDVGIMQVGIFENHNWNSALWTATDSGTFNLSVPVVPGDKIDFGVWCQRGGYANGNTPLEATVTAVPEPSTFALLAAGAIGLLGLARRQKQK